MNHLLVVSLLACVVAVVQADTYTSQYDNIDVDEILANNRAYTSYLKCLLDQAPCTPPGKELKVHFPEALETHCAKCSGPQKQQIGKTIAFMKANRPDDLAQVMNKYDPQRKYRTQYGEYFENF